MTIRDLFSGLYRLCACGCKILIPILAKWGHFARFKKGHHNYLRKGNGLFRNKQEYDKHYRKRNREKISVKRKKYYQLHRERFHQYHKKKYALNPEKYKKWSLNKVVFLGKQIYVGFRQLTGYCSYCPNNVFDGSCKRTHMHHLLYVPIMIWSCRIELCVSCHRKEKGKAKLL